jgi:hypothetical protein
MSVYKMLLCLSCDTEVEVDKSRGEKFRWDHEGGGPYCVDCWRWQSQIDVLKERVAKLEARRTLTL